MAQKTLAQRDRNKQKTAKAAVGITKPSNSVTTHTSPPDVLPTGNLTFITSEGESLTFPALEMPVGEATAIAGEEALSKIWNRTAEEAAWRDM